MGGTCDALIKQIRNTSQLKATAETPNPQAGAVLRCLLILPLSRYIGSGLAASRSAN